VAVAIVAAIVKAKVELAVVPYYAIKALPRML